MNCVDRKELEQFLKGKLDPQRLIAVDEHISACPGCRNALANLPNQMSACAELGAALLDVQDCPEYEELSAFVGNSLNAERKGWIAAHANMCELCTRDIARITELRSHASMREKIVVKPGMTRRHARQPFVWWKRVLAGVSVAGVAAVIYAVTSLGPATQMGTQIAKNPPTQNIVPNATKPADQPKPAPNAQPKQTPEVTPDKPVNPVIPNIKPTPPKRVAPPSYVAVLKDGAYSVIRRDGALSLTKGSGNARTPLEARIAASIAEKLRTGKVKPPKSYQVAMATIAMRDDNSGYEAPPMAPKQTAPMGKILLSNTPSFAWSAVDLAESYRIRIYDQSGNMMFEGTTDKNAFTPSKPLARGQVYSWRVAVRFSESEPWAESAAARFAVLSSQDYASIKKVQSQMPGSHLALGATYESFGLYSEAANEYRALKKQNPNSKLAQKLLDETEAGR